MKLSNLVYECIKNGVYLSDTKFLYGSFMSGEFNDDVDFKNQINNVWFPINEALHRLSSRDKIPNRYEKVEVRENNIVDLTDFQEIRDVRNVFQVSSTNDYKKVNHRRVGNLLILFNFDSKKDIYIEYKVDIPNFNSETLDEIRTSEKDIDLKSEYSISDTACSFIIEYVKSALLEQIAPEMANMHRTIAEQYFNDLETMNNGFEQQKVQPIYTMER